MKKPRIIEGPLYFARHAPSKAEVRAQIEEGFRAAAIERGQIDKEERIVPIIFATEAPVMRYFGRERLICSPDACRVQRMNGKAPLLSEHDRSKQIGVIVPNSVEFGADRKARCKVRFAKHGQLAEEEWNNLIDDIRGTFSVGYVVHRLILREEDDKEGDLYDAVDWEPLENSLVSVPADPDCIIDGRAETSDKHTVLVQAETEKTSIALTSMRTRNYFSRFLESDKGGGSGAGDNSNKDKEQQRQAQELEAQRKQVIEDARKAETERVRELGHLGAKYGISEKAVEYITGAKSVQEFKDYIMDNDIRPLSKRSQDPGNGANPLLTNTGTRQAPLARTMGEVLAFSDEYKAFAEGGRSKRSHTFAFPVTSARATLTTSEIPTQSVSIDRIPGIIPDLQQRLTVADLIAPGTTSSSKILYMREVSYTNAATTVAEGGQKPEATFNLEETESPVRKIAVTARISDEMLADYNYIQSFIDSRLRFMVEEREEAQLLSGDGNSPNLTGILNTVGIQTQAKSTDSIADAVHKGITKVRVTGRSEPTGIVMHPNDWERHALTKDANGQYMSGGPTYAPYGNGMYSSTERMWGMPVVPTTAITEGTALLGAFRTQAQIFRRTGITVESTNSNEDDFEKNLVSFRVEERLALCIYRPSAFATVTGLNA